ncbi:lysophospholipase-like family protein [Gracilibacillus boraciitolerans JCM 21714]|uniref:Lysophospholipase-like family protein n=1 Tax=Gracilibacillus boraciitolerans JCM 21714 TaxID=1298598 RepID=W4VEI6_9BACI|nr:patatin-like phospholipase family protein [Gracilibacillus boraciitolerans]GAE91228.1 lysophospholipase-like family protein [Gracilibacillus boraciitolerans JCM 21714]
MKIDGVFSGGGVKAYTFLGALQALEEKNIQFERVAGTSAGALFATFIAAGYTAKEMKDIFLDLPLDSFLDQSKLSSFFPFIKWLTLFQTMGLYRGNNFELWLQEKLSDKGIIHFTDLPFDKLKIVAADLTLNQVVIFPDDLKRNYHIEPSYFKIAKAVRSSISIPYFFRPSKIMNPLTRQKSYLVDGMILSNFPLWLFDREDAARVRPILGMQLTDQKQFYHHAKISNAIEMLLALMGTMRNAYDTKYISENIAKDILFFPINDVNATDFNLSKEKKEKLIDLGYKRTIQYLLKWSR